MTPGEAAHAGYVANDTGPDLADSLWARVGQHERGRWERGAANVETGQLRLAREDRDQLRKQVLDLAAALEAEGAEEIAIARKRQGPADEIGKNRGRVFNLCASRIRRIAEPPS
jgi:hypothetical protein